MIRKLIKTGNSVAFVVPKEMQEHLLIKDGVIEYEYTDSGVFLKRRKPERSFDDALASTLDKYHEAFVELAK